MANTRAQGVGLDTTSFKPQSGASGAGGLPALPQIDMTRATDMRERVFAQLSQQTGQIADQMAADEGKRAGQVAGLEGDFRPGNTPTIRGRAYDAAATATYLSGVQSNYQKEALDLFDKHRADPVGLAQAMDGLKSTYEKQHVFPQIMGDFRQLADQTALHYRKAALNQLDSDNKEKFRAGAIRDIATRGDAMQRVFATDPTSPEAEALAQRNEAADIATIRAQVTEGALAADRAEQMIVDRRARTSSEIISARGDTLKTTADVEAYRAKVRQDFGAGKYPHLDFQTTDAALAKLGKQRQAQADHQLGELKTNVSDFLDRQSKGLPPPASEWLALEQKAQAAGPQGVAALDAARMKLRLRSQIESLPVADGEKLVRGYEERMRDGGGSGVAALRPFLAQGKASSHLDNMDAALSGPLARMFADAPPEVRRVMQINSGHRSTERQAQLYQADIEKNGGAPSGYVAQPGHSNHEKGIAADLLFDGSSRPTSAAGVAAKEWMHANAEKYGLHFRMLPEKGSSLNEPWHIEPIDRTPKGNGAAGGGIDAVSADVLTDGRAALERKRALIAQDPLLAGSREGYLAKIPDLDFAKGGDAVAAQLPARMAAADAAAKAYGRAPVYIRPDEKDAINATLRKGGDAALDLVSGVIKGAGDKAPRLLSEVGGEAPALAHAGLVMMSTGDKAFARQVAEAQKAEAVDGAKLPKPREQDLSEAWRVSMGGALNGLAGEEAQRTQAAALQWARVEMWRRGVDPAKDLTQVKTILAEGVQRARGMTGQGENTFGGLAEVGFGGGGWFAKYGQAVKVQVPSDVRTSKFGEALDAIRDDDVKTLRNPPVDKTGAPLKAADLRRLQPVFTPGGYQFARVDPVTNQMTPVVAADGKAFTLDWKALAPTLRDRVPGAFR